VSWLRTALPKQRPEADPVLVKAITEAMTAGNGRSHLVKGHAELMTRLTEDGVQFEPKALYVTLSGMINEKLIERRPGVGMWLDNSARTLWQVEPTRLKDIDGPSWGPN
jgi:hypothetical protein